jgi:hypothetical protein
MNADSIDLTLLLGSMALEVILIALLVWRRIYQTLPAFVSFMAWELCCNAIGIRALQLSFHAYLWFYIVGLAANTLFQFFVLAELVKVVLRINRTSAPSRIMVLILIALTSFLLWSLTRWAVFPNMSPLNLFFQHMRQVLAVFWVALQLTIALMSRIKNLHWPDRELRIVTGIGFTSIVSLTVIILHTHPMTRSQFHLLDQIVIASYFGVLAYWVLSFV